MCFLVSHDLKSEFMTDEMSWTTSQSAYSILKSEDICVDIYLHN